MSETATLPRLQRLAGTRPVLVTVTVLALVLLARDSCRASGAVAGVAPPAQSLAVPGLRNLFAVGTNFFSGGLPEGDAAFAELARLGVKTIVSVDGAKPDLTTARQHGLRYVHLPLGYGGVPANRVAELVTAASLPGPIYVHCHQGKHRGPAALAVMCLAAEDWTSDRAEAWLRQAGTAEDYPGLYRAVREFRLPDAATLAAVKNLPEVAKVSTLVATMVTVDKHFDRLKQAHRAGWKPSPDHSVMPSVHEATLLWEQLRELFRHDDTRQRPAEYRTKLAESEQAADAFRQHLLNAGKDSALLSAGSLARAFKQLGQTCVACHRKYRDE